MRKLFHFVHQSVDGYIEGPNGEFDWPQMGPELSAYSKEVDDRVDAILYGRVVWEMMSAYWPVAETLSDHPHDLNYAPVWRAKQKIVVSSTLQQADWNTRVINENVIEQVAALKQQPGKDIVLMGGQKLATVLAREGLIDERCIVTHPVLLGGGRSLFDEEDSRTNLALVETRTFDARSVLLRFEVTDRPV
jgi:dihydrofolate reductase